MPARPTLRLRGRGRRPKAGAPAEPASPGCSRMKIVFADLIEELAAADSEPFGGPGAIAAAGQQRALDRPPLDLGQQGAEGDRLGRVFGGGERRVGRLVDVE